MALEEQAPRSRGRVIPLLGNHEVMNVAGDLRYVTPGGMRDFDGVHTPALRVDGLTHQTRRQVEVARLATKNAAVLYDEGDPGVAEAANIAKFVGAEAALKALDQAIQVHGGNGLSHEYGLSELWFVTRLMRTAPVSREMVLNFVAQTSLGLPRSY